MKIIILAFIVTLISTIVATSVVTNTKASDPKEIPIEYLSVGPNMGTYFKFNDGLITCYVFQGYYKGGISCIK